MNRTPDELIDAMAVCATSGTGGFLIGDNEMARLVEEYRRRGAQGDQAPSNVVELPVVTKLDIPTERVLARAGEAELNFVVVVGEATDGSLYFASSRGGGPDVLWVLEQAKLALLKAGGAWPE